MALYMDWWTAGVIDGIEYPTQVQVSITMERVKRKDVILDKNVSDDSPQTLWNSRAQGKLWFFARVGKKLKREFQRLENLVGAHIFQRNIIDQRLACRSLAQV